VQFSLITDKKVCKNPQAIIDRFRPEFENLVHAVLLMPWDEEADPKIASRALDATDALADAAQHLRHNGVAASLPSLAPEPGTASAADVADASPPAATAARPAGLRKRKSAFAAARSSAQR
jgi:hypothetical protein